MHANPISFHSNSYSDFQIKNKKSCEERFELLKSHYSNILTGGPFIEMDNPFGEEIYSQLKEQVSTSYEESIETFDRPDIAQDCFRLSK